MSSAVSLASLSGSQTPRLKSLPPLSLYIHLPWCIRKCPYCDFNSHEVRGGGSDTPEEEYVAALIRDLEESLPQVWGRKVVSVFFGGGTPRSVAAGIICGGNAGGQSGNIRSAKIRGFSCGRHQPLIDRNPELQLEAPTGAWPDT